MIHREGKQDNGSPPVRIAQVFGCMDGYGSENYVMNFYRYIDRNKIQFDFIVREDSAKIPYEEINRLGGRVFLVPPYRQLAKHLRVLKYLFRENRYQIVQTHVDTRSIFALMAAEEAGVPIRIVNNHTLADKSEWKNYMLRQLIKVKATHYVSASRYSAVRFFGRKAVKQGRVEIFHPVIELENYTYDEDVRSQVRQELGLNGRFVVGHVGRFCSQKNHEFLIDIFQSVHQRRPYALLLLAGDGETMTMVRRKIEQLGLRDDVLMLGNRNDAGRLYQAMDVFVLPSRFEGLPTVAVEAQRAGLKVVTSTRVTEETKVRSDMAFLELSAGAEKWAEEAVRTDTGTRSCIGDFSRFDATCQARRLERYYLRLLRSRGISV